MIRRGTPVLVLATVLLLLIAGAGRAGAVGYRYWSFWDRDGDTWTYATQGPSTAHPADGSVQGFRFSVSADSKDSAKPRGNAEFSVICAKTRPKGGAKRVALVIDFGTASDAPSGETPPRARTACASVPPEATTADALAAVAKPLRYDTNALLCAIAGYPERGCGEQVSTHDKTHDKPTATPEKSSKGPSVGLLAGAAAVAALGAAAVWQARRRRG